MKNIILFLVICLAIMLVAAGYFGFIPGLSSLMGANKPQDLGITYTQTDVTAIPTKSYSIPQTSNATPASVIFTQSEASAALNTTTWPYHPFTNVQVKFGPSNKVEASGNIVTSRLAGYFKAMGINQPQAQEAFDRLKLMPNPSFYIDGTAVVIDNKINLSINSLKVGKITVPSNLINDNKSYVTSFINQKLNETAFNFKSIKPEDNQLKIDLIRK